MDKSQGKKSEELYGIWKFMLLLLSLKEPEFPSAQHSQEFEPTQGCSCMWLRVDLPFTAAGWHYSCGLVTVSGCNLIYELVPVPLVPRLCWSFWFGEQTAIQPTPWPTLYYWPLAFKSHASLPFSLSPEWMSHQIYHRLWYDCLQLIFGALKVNDSDFFLNVT